MAEAKVKTSLYLPEALHADLTEAADVLSRPTAVLIRDILRAWVQQYAAGTRRDDLLPSADR